MVKERKVVGRRIRRIRIRRNKPSWRWLVNGNDCTREREREQIKEVSKQKVWLEGNDDYKHFFSGVFNIIAIWLQLSVYTDWCVECSVIVTSYSSNHPPYVIVCMHIYTSNIGNDPSHLLPPHPSVDYVLAERSAPSLC